ncbi:BQ5605_C023g09674 [Microbotryum silenes-dioicae]|uniref:ATP-dependent RNA helicase n=1 Tax=Microbotryum silenes-dioicae TaxID=796604 RepID=A0A2X0PF09_9BASI|nr:BQ5605_C023g09674 [Microbotryum silenes-dioicae]
MFGTSLRLARTLPSRASALVRPHVLSLHRSVVVASFARSLTTTPSSGYAQIASGRVGGRVSTSGSRAVYDDTPVAIEDDSAEVDADPEQRPAATFASIKDTLHAPIFKAITQRPFKYETMSEVQEAVLALLPRLSNPPLPTTSQDGASESIEQAQDLLVRAKTGTGKTLAFLIPALEGRLRQLEAYKVQWERDNPDAPKAQAERALNKYAKSSVGALILSPTRELATQIATEASALMSHLPDMGVRLFVGGASKSLQYRDWVRSSSNDIVVATPGRILDFLSSEENVRAPLSAARMLILDEADTLLDMGFADALADITGYLPDIAQRQTFLFSATVSKQIREVARKSMKQDHVFVDTVKASDIDTHLHIPQYYTVLPDPKSQLIHVLRLLAHDQLLHARKAAANGGEQGGKAVIFLPTTRMTQMFSLVLQAMKAHFPWARDTHIVEIHSKKDQNQRTRASDSFRKNKTGYSILVTSDVSARGVDYPGVTRVIQIGVPGSRDLYIHRVGRTGRAGKEGRGDIVLLPWEGKYVSSQLRDIPMQHFSVEDGEKALNEAAEEWDQDPPETRVTAEAESRGGFTKRTSKSIRDRRVGFVRAPQMSSPVAPRLESLEDSLRTSVLPSLDEEAVRDAFASMLGYYAPRSSDLRVTKSEIVQGLKDWATGSMGLEQEPYVSSMFLAKIGMNDRGSSRNNSSGRFGGSRDNGGSRGGRPSSFDGYRSQRDSRPMDSRINSAGKYASKKNPPRAPRDGGYKPRAFGSESSYGSSKPSFGYGGSSSPYDNDRGDRRNNRRSSPSSRY